MKAYSHPGYNDALRQAVRISSQAEISQFADARVWFIPEANSIGVSKREDNYGPQNAMTVCYAQKWDETTVQLRFQGGESEFVKV